MKLRAFAAVLAFLLPTTLLALSPVASAGVGDIVASVGNPCSASLGAGTGIAVKENGANGIAYYASQNQSKIHFFKTAAPYTCQGSITPAGLPANNGWNALAYDAYHASVRLWAARNNSGTVYGLTLAGAVVTSFTAPGATNVYGLAVDEAVPHHLFVATGSTTVLRYDVSTPTPTAQAPATFAYGVAHLAAWGGALLTSDGVDNVRNAKPTGQWLGLLLHAGQPTQDPWWQTGRNLHYYNDMAFDEQTIPIANGGILWTIDTSGGWRCVQFCPVGGCLLYEGPDCIQWGCVQNCDPAQEVWAYQIQPSIRSYEVRRACPTGVVVAPGAECPCKQPLPAPVFTSPTNFIHLRGSPASPSPMPIIVQGSALVTATGSSPSHEIKLTGPGVAGPTVTGFGAATAAPVVASATPRGAYTYTATLWDGAVGCRGGSANLTVWVEDPTTRTAAQGIRVEGNIPLHLVAGSIRAEPMDDLRGTENATVMDRSSDASLAYDALVFEANATHGPRVGQELVLDASARAVAIDVSGSFDLATLCFDLTADPGCAVLPTLLLSEDDLRAYAQVELTMVNPTTWTNAWTSLHSDKISTAGATASTSTPPCPTDVLVRATYPPYAASYNYATGQGCVIAAGGIVVTFAESWQRSGPLFAEAYANAMRIHVTTGIHKGEIVIAEAYAASSLNGSAWFAGVPQFVAKPDDYQTGADAPATGGATLLPGAYAGAFSGADRKDAFKVDVSIGEKLRVLIDPAHRAAAMAAPLPTLPAGHVAPRLLRVTLIDPNGVVRDTSHLGVLDAHPAQVELNVDITDTWSILVERLDTRDELAPYTVSIALTPVGLIPETDPGASCLAATPMGAPTVTGAMGANDAADFWRLATGSGEAITAILQADDANGVDLDLYLYDTNCQPVAWSTQGKDPDAKGEADHVENVPVPVGAAYLEVRRVNGIGNYALTASAHKKV